MGSGGLPRTKTIEVVQMTTGYRGTDVVWIVVAIFVFGRLEDCVQANGAGVGLVRGHLIGYRTLVSRRNSVPIGFVPFQKK